MEEMVDRAFEMTRSLYRHSTIDNMLERLVEAVSEFLRAERGGLFWFANGETQKPELKVTRNLMREEIFSDEFKDSLALVMESFQKSIPILCFQKDTEANPLKASKRPVICVPVTIGKSARGVLFHDNIHLNNDVDLLNEALLMKLSHYISQHIDYISMYSQQDTIKPNHGDVYQSASNTGDHEIITRHPGFLKELKTLDKIADSKATVLITGETGTGKELIARRVHQMSPRITEPFIVVDLTSISPNLVESELFGHEKGSFTGADRQKIGRFELAHRGTLFIDELGDIPLSIQVKLLRVFQERTFVRVGGVQTIHSDFRLVAATNRNLEKEMSAGRFREDLYYRLNVVPVTIPPLRERGCDIIFL
ncbi:sigma 54-interacting transcriptional regulator, partial [bacterium]|nr:sigma 54-interacting transcriptional regulator [bacterium]